MKIDSDNVQLFLTFICGCVCFWIGIRAKKVEAKKQAGILSICLGICFFVECILRLFEDFLRANHLSIHAISTMELVVAGMMLGIYSVMWIFGHWELLKNPRKTSNEDSQTGDLK